MAKPVKVIYEPATELNPACVYLVYTTLQGNIRQICLDHENISDTVIQQIGELENVNESCPSCEGMHTCQGD